MLMFVAALMIALPAIAVIVWFTIGGEPTLVLPALASFFIGIIPFVVVYLIIRAQKRKGEEFDAH